MEHYINIYTDGSCASEFGGWAAVAMVGEYPPVILKGREKATTNNRMEMMGILAGFRHLNTLGIIDPSWTIGIYTDSKYVISTMESNLDRWAKTLWIRNGMLVKNADIWKRLHVMKKKFPQVELVHVRGHKGVYWNEVCDFIAKLESKTCKEEVEKP